MFGSSLRQIGSVNKCSSISGLTLGLLSQTGAPDKGGGGGGGVEVHGGHGERGEEGHGRHGGRGEEGHGGHGGGEDEHFFLSHRFSSESGMLSCILWLLMLLLSVPFLEDLSKLPCKDFPFLVDLSRLPCNDLLGKDGAGYEGGAVHGEQGAGHGGHVVGQGGHGVGQGGAEASCIFCSS